MNANRLVPVAVTCIAALLLGACSPGPKPVTDAELIALLHREGTAADAKKPMLDPMGVNCLRALSGDPKLAIGLPAALSKDEGRKVCRVRLENLIGATERNPDHRTLAEFTTVAAATRAAALLAQNTPPAMAAAEARAARQPAYVPPPVDSAALAAKLDTYTKLCAELKQKVGMQTTAPGMVGNFARVCDRRVEQFRRNLDRLSASNDNAQGKWFATALDRQIQFAQRMLDREGSTPAPAPAPESH